MKKIICSIVLGSLITASIPKEANAFIAIAKKVSCEKEKKKNPKSQTLDCVDASSMAISGSLYLFGGPIFGAVMLGKAVKSHGVDRPIGVTVSAIFVAIAPIIGLFMLDEKGNKELSNLDNNSLPLIQERLGANALSDDEISAFNTNKVELMQMSGSIREATKDKSEEEAKIIAESYKVEFASQVEDGDKALSALDKVLTASVLE